MPEAKLPMGDISITQQAFEALLDGEQEPKHFLQRHQSGDWGEVDFDDAMLNDQAVTSGTRILSAYSTSKGVRLWVITEADRGQTTILLPEEY